MRLSISVATWPKFFGPALHDCVQTRIAYLPAPVLISHDRRGIFATVRERETTVSNGQPDIPPGNPAEVPPQELPPDIPPGGPIEEPPPPSEVPPGSPVEVPQPPTGDSAD
jgi:hypothetical protein